MDLLINELSDHISILNELYELQEVFDTYKVIKFLDILFSIFLAVKVKRDFGNIYLEMDTLSSTMKIFENKKGNGEKMDFIYLYYLFIYYFLDIYIMESFNYYYNEGRRYTYL